MDKKEEIKNNYRFLKSIITRCIFEKNKDKKVILYRSIMNSIDMSMKNDLKSIDFFNELIDRLTMAGKTIQEQNELLECFYEIMGKRSYDIVNTWKTLKDKRNKKED